MMDWLNGNFENIIIIAILLTGLGSGVYMFLHSANSKQKEIVLTWLLQAVVEAEKKFGSQSGQLKLSHVYNLYITKFPVISKIIPRKVFLILVDEALKQMVHLIENSLSVYKYVKDDDI